MTCRLRFNGHSMASQSKSKVEFKYSIITVQFPDTLGYDEHINSIASYVVSSWRATE